jgi:hypothetical protein
VKVTVSPRVISGLSARTSNVVYTRTVPARAHAPIEKLRDAHLAVVHHRDIARIRRRMNRGESRRIPWPLNVVIMTVRPGED